MKLKCNGRISQNFYSKIKKISKRIDLKFFSRRENCNEGTSLKSSDESFKKSFQAEEK